MLILFSDFGLNGPYVGQMKAVLHAAAPEVAVVDLMHDAPAFNPKASGYLLAALAAWLPPGCVVLAVVDPGVGTAREAVAVEVDRRWFVGPDNGLFIPLCRQAAELRWHRIAWRPAALSASFHGRDLFAPIAARLATGKLAPGMIEPASPVVMPDWPADLAEVIYLDHYGNALTGLRASTLAMTQTLSVADHVLPRAQTFAEVASGQAFCYPNSSGLIEIAVNQGSAAEQLSLSVGSALALTPHRQ